MEDPSDLNVHRCHICHETVIPEWQPVCEKCWERHEEELEEEAEAEHLDHLIHLDELRERLRQRRRGDGRC